MIRENFNKEIGHIKKKEKKNRKKDQLEMKNTLDVINSKFDRKIILSPLSC